MNNHPIFRKMRKFKAAILLYQISLQCKNFVKLKNTQLFCLVIKLRKSFAVPKACTRCIGIIYFRADNYTDVIENFQSDTYAYK